MSWIVRYHDNAPPSMDFDSLQVISYVLTRPGRELLFTVQSGSRLFGCIGASATLGQLFGSLFAASMAWLGPCTRVSL
jgi:hypothetical protein